MKNSPYYIAPAGARTHDLPHTQTYYIAPAGARTHDLPHTQTS